MSYMYCVYCFLQNLKRVITSSAVTALEIKKYECLRLVEIYRMTHENRHMVAHLEPILDYTIYREYTYTAYIINFGVY